MAGRYSELEMQFYLHIYEQIQENSNDIYIYVSIILK